MAERLFLIDAMAMIYRAYFAMIGRPLKNPKGDNVSAIYGFVNSMIKILEEEKPDHIAVCFDTEKPTFRHKEFPAYKAQRAEIPDDMPWQINEVKEIVKMFNIPSIELDGYEADDIIGTLVKQAEKEKVESYMVTPDKDYMQLVSDFSFMYKPSKSSTGNRVADVEIVRAEQVKIKFGVTPDKVIEVLGLMGDTADNIPGVKGVGEKTAIALIQEYGSIDDIYKNIDKVKKPKLKEILLKDKDNAYQARRLVTIKTDVPLDVNFHHLNIKEPEREKLTQRFEELGMKTFARKFGAGLKFSAESPPVEAVKKRANEDVSLKITIKGGKIEPEIPESSNIKTLKDVKHSYYTIKDNAAFDKLLKKLSTEEIVSFDTETTSTDFNDASLVGMSFAYQENQAFYVPVCGAYTSDKTIAEDSLFSQPAPERSVGVDINYAIEKVKLFLENKKIKKVGQNIKYDCLIMKKYGIEIRNIHFDSMIGSYVLNPEEQHGMDDLAVKWLNYRPVPISELIGKGKNQITMAEVEISKISEYAAEDADVTLQLFHRLEYELQKTALIKVCTEIEFPLIDVLTEMEFEGIKVDEKILKVLDAELIKYITEYEGLIYEDAGERFNINSPQQLSNILINKLHLKLTKKTKPGFSTDISVLEDLKYEHPIAKHLIEYRMLTKLKSTYVDGLMKSVSPVTGRVHTSFLQIGAATGRLSSVNPNLQNIPVKSEAGRNIRKAFVPRDENFKILSADYSQIELRVMAHVSGDENFINAFKRNRDIHTETAMRVFNLKNKSEVNPARRRKAKEVNFGIIYGIGAFGLASRLEIKNTEAKEIIDRYFREFPKVFEYLEKTKKFAHDKGYVETLKGRRRYLPQINNNNATVRAEEERAAINMPIQGTAADLIKIAMIEIHRIFKEKKLKSKMLLQVHDELVFEVHNSELDEVEKIVRREMKNAIKLDVPVEVEIGVGKNWFDAH
ncbi:MAG: DNA polymerase I [Ignavibacteria bacterium]|nr:DNA polymerase I [Ignavibacteria bacterium]